jgi:hypothetical protein
MKERNETTEQVKLRDNGVQIDLPGHENNQSSLRYLKYPGADSIAADLLKNGGSQVVDVLEEVIQLAWTSETLSEILNQGDIVLNLQKKRDKLGGTNYRGICQKQQHEVTFHTNLFCLHLVCVMFFKV